MKISDFFKKIELIPFHSCWEWVGATNGKYGTYGGSLSKKRGYSHRFSYEFHFGEIPKGMFVCHKCDNPTCVNPCHLFLGTPKDNMVDMHSKNRQKTRPGIKAPACKLTEEQILEIRNCSLSSRKIGKLYGISNSHVCRIKNKKKWKHL